MAPNTAAILKVVFKCEQQVSEWPEVTVGLFIENPTPFLREFFAKFSRLNYPKSKMTVLVHNNVSYYTFKCPCLSDNKMNESIYCLSSHQVQYHKEIVEKFFVDSKNEYFLLKYIAPEDDSPEVDHDFFCIQICFFIKTNSIYYTTK